MIKYCEENTKQMYMPSEKIIFQADGFYKINSKTPKKLVVWGCGELGTKAIQQILGIPIDVFVDKNSGIRKIFTQKTEKRVISPQKFFETFAPGSCFVVVCASLRNEENIRKILFKRGFLFGVDMLYLDDFMNNCYSFFAMYVYNFLHVPIVTFSVTDYCTLRCKECSLKIPYRAENKKRHRTLLEVQKDTSLFFKKVDYTEEVSIVGGEPLLWPELSKYLRWLYENYSQQYRQARIISNGTILLTPEIQRCLKENKILYELTVYPGVVHQNKIYDNEQICEKNNITYRKIDHPFWFDFGLREKNYHPQIDNQMLFEECDSLCRGVDNGQMIYCFPGYFSAKTMNFPVDKGAILLDEMAKFDLYNFYYGIFANEHPCYCEYCNGFSNAPKIPVAEQIND
jgi:hypothetical protein